MDKDKELVKEVVKEILIDNHEFFERYVQMVMNKVITAKEEKRKPVGFIIT